MAKAAIVVLADTETKESLGRVVNAMQVVKEFKEAGDEVLLIFDGAGVKWSAELTKEDHSYHSLFEDVKDKVGGFCKYCAKAFGVTESVENNNLPYSEDYEGHPSFRNLMNKGYQVVVF